MDGIAPSDGGILANGYALEADGNDGFLTSSHVTGGGTFISTLETFVQSTGTVKTAASATTICTFAPFDVHVFQANGKLRQGFVYGGRGIGGFATTFPQLQPYTYTP